MTVAHAATNRRQWLSLAAACFVVGLSIACGSGSPSAQVTPTPDLPQEEALATEEAAGGGETALRWGYNPLKPSNVVDDPPPEEDLPQGYRLELVVEGLEAPTHLAALPDGRLLIAEQAGRVLVLQDGVLLGEPFLSLDVYSPEKEGVNEFGLVGIAVGPEYQGQTFLYAYYTRGGQRQSVLVRARVGGQFADEPEEIFAWTAAPECCHVGGGMTFMADGTLLLGMGDHQAAGDAQDPQLPPGSILRLNRDGTVPIDNPFGSAVWAYGLRNPYDVAFDPATGRVYTGENGFFGQDALIEVTKGANYGWPGLGLSVPREEIAEPLIFYPGSAGMAGLEFYSSDVLSDFQGRLFFCRFHTGTVQSVQFNPDGSVLRETTISDHCYTDITTGADGFLYFLDYVEGAVYRIARDED